MIKDFVLNENHVRFERSFDSWEEAIRRSADSLVNDGYMNESYREAMVDVVKEHGPYIVIAPNIAMPHARPEKGAKKVGFSVTVVNEPVQFSEDSQFHARILITLSCVDSKTHLEMMQALVEVLGEEENINKILNTKNKQTVLDLFNREDN